MLRKQKNISELAENVAEFIRFNGIDTKAVDLDTILQAYFDAQQKMYDEIAAQAFLVLR